MKVVTLYIYGKLDFKLQKHYKNKLYQKCTHSVRWAMLVYENRSLVTKKLSPCIGRGVKQL